jgi:hypothetical protein
MRNEHQPLHSPLGGRWLRARDNAFVPESMFQNGYCAASHATGKAEKPGSVYPRGHEQPLHSLPLFRWYLVCAPLLFQDVKPMGNPFFIKPQSSVRITSFADKFRE